MLEVKRDIRTPRLDEIPEVSISARTTPDVAELVNGKFVLSACRSEKFDQTVVVFVNPEKGSSEEYVDSLLRMLLTSAVALAPNPQALVNAVSDALLERMEFETTLANVAQDN